MVGSFLGRLEGRLKGGVELVERGSIGVVKGVRVRRFVVLRAGARHGVLWGFLSFLVYFLNFSDALLRFLPLCLFLFL